VPLRLRVRNVEYLGADWILYGVLEGGRFAGRAVRARLLDASGFKLDDVRDFAVPEDKLRFFDRATEKRTAPVAMEWS